MIAVTNLAREHSGQVLASLAQRYGDLDAADEGVQEALIEAATRWPNDGVPDNPGGWMYRVAQRKTIDRLRRADSARRRLDAAAHELVQRDEPSDNERGLYIDDLESEDMHVTDERLRLILLCCHPALNADAQVALTLRMVGGLTTEEIAAGFLVPTPTLAARITRAKKKIRTANIPLGMPDQIDERIDAVLAVLYLIFNEGYLSRVDSAEPLRIDLCEEAIRLSEIVHTLAQDHADVLGLIALLRLIHSRRDSRFRNGELVVLDKQDRSGWHLDEIRAGNETLRTAMALMRPGVYQLQALIAAQHSNARTAEETDWSRIVALYDQLIAMRPSPIVALNRAVAVAMADGAPAGLRALGDIDDLDTYHLFHATRGELHARNGDTTAARSSFERAISLSVNPTETSHLRTRLREL